MKKRGLFFIIMVMVCLFLTAPLTAETKNKELVRIGTHPVGAFFNVIGNAVGKAIENETNLKSKVMPLSGPGAWMPMMVRGEMDVGICNSQDANWGYFGEKIYKELSGGEGFPVRLILTGTYNDVTVVTSQKTNIKTMKDLKGKKVAAGFTGATACQYQFKAHLANAGLSLSDVKVMPVVAPPPAVKAVIEGKAHAAGTATTGFPLVSELDSKKGARFLSYDPSPEAQKRALKHYPTGWLKEIKAGSFPGVEKDTWFLRYENYVLCRADLADETVHAIIKAMWDYNDQLGSIHSKFKEWEKENYASQKLTVPYHPAAKAFLKEKGLWTSELEKRQKALLSKKGVKQE